MARKTKLDKLKEKYKGIKFKQSPYNKQKISWWWKDMHGLGIKYSELEWNISYKIEMHNKYNPTKKIKI